MEKEIKCFSQEEIHNDLLKKIDEEQIYMNEPMKKHTTFKVGGNADFFVKVKTIDELKFILQYTKKNNIPLTIIGNGSNLLVKDNGIRGITIQLKLENIEIDGSTVIVGSSVKLAVLAIKLLENELTGFEFASGIPGTMGGAICMNAGAYGSEMKDVVKQVTCIDYDGNEIILSNSDMEFSYRNSILKKKDLIVLQVVLEFIKGNKEEIKQKMDEYKKSRIEKQPLELPNAGSTFKRGEDFVTAMLIDQAGLKGYKIGGAQVSLKHAGFVVNTGDATAKDILDLIAYIKKTIKEKFDKDIQEEIIILGE